MKIAAITMVFNEAVFLPIWLQHYGTAVGAENLFVIDDGSTDLSTSQADSYHCLKKRRAAFDEEDRVALVGSFHRELLKHYDVVIYTDVDELIVVDPKLGLTLRDYISAAEFEYRNAVAFHVVHHLGREAPISFDQPLFKQRRYAEFDLKYCKPLIAKVPMEWGPGFHWLEQLPPRYDTNLLLFHLRAMDLDIAMARLKSLQQVAWSSNALAKRHSVQFRLSEVDYVARHFTVTDATAAGAQSDFDFLRGVLHGEVPQTNILVRIPDRFAESIVLAHQATSARAGGIDASAVPSDETIHSLFAASVEVMTASRPSRSRNESCPCGSGKRYKHCHGALT
jgi:Glycosyl transferase family 2/SEC-C motif